MAGELNGKRIAFLVANEGIEQVELTEPWAAVRDAGGQETWARCCTEGPVFDARSLVWAMFPKSNIAIGRRTPRRFGASSGCAPSSTCWARW